MKRALLMVVALSLMSGTVVVAQEHWTEGPVWGCGSYRTKPGQFNNYMKWLRSNYLVTSDTAKEQGLILDSKVLLREPSSPEDWNVLICTLHESFGKAQDYNAEDEAKWDAIQAEHWGTDVDDEMREMAAKRFEMREFIGVRYQREVTLKPME